MRHLASIQRILSLDPIPDADQIEVASILGWKCVVKKGEFSVGDACAYIEVDSLLPDRPEFEFMKPRGMRVRTVKLRGQVSQGLALPCSILEPDMNHTEGRDVTEQLSITKYTPPIPAQLAGDAKGTFPGFLKKTDEERIQTMPWILEKYEGALCRVCEKLDGSSATYYLRDGEFGVCSRNQELKETEGNSFWRVARELKLEERLRDYGRNIALQGELIGEGIQKNKYGLKGQTVKFFDVFDIDNFRHMNIREADDVYSTLALDQAPIVCDELLGGSLVDALVMMATRRSVLKPDVWAEGIVIRSYNDVTETFVTGGTVNRGRLSFKVINPSFLLKYDE